MTIKKRKKKRERSNMDVGGWMVFIGYVDDGWVKKFLFLKTTVYSF
jgi:hypothetical protein